MSADKNVVGIHVTFTSSLWWINVIPYSHPELTAWHTDPIYVVTWNMYIKYVHTNNFTESLASQIQNYANR